MEAGTVSEIDLTPQSMAPFSLHCQARLHTYCPGDDGVMRCICECHGKDKNVER